MEKANTLLGAVYSVEGVITHGNGIGRSRLGFPTVNLDVPAGKLLPRFGVYATEVVFGNGVSVRGITNVGENPTVSEDRLNHRVRIETFLLDFSGDVYGEKICIRFFRFLRPERKFGSLEELRTQIAKDIAYMQHS